MKTSANLTRLAALLAAASGLAACGGYVDGYEAAVYDKDPAYCYQSLANVECYQTPYPRYAEHLVSYQGPHPSRYPAPPIPETPELKAPEAVNYWVKDAEPVPRPSPVGYRQGSLPWLDQPVRPTPVPGEEQVSDASQQATDGVPLAAPSSDGGRKPTLRVPARRTVVPLANPNQGYYLNSGAGSPGGGSAGLNGGAVVPPAS